MDKFQHILRNSKTRAQQTVNTTMSTPQMQKLQEFTRRDVTKFIQDNKFVRYLLYGIILVKAYSIYDKFKQVVAINNVKVQLIEDSRKNMKNVFQSEEMIQDLITRKILEENKLIDDEEILTKGIMYKPEFQKTKYI
eukprot:403361714